MQWGNMEDEKKKETKIEKKDEFGNTVEKTEIEEKEEEDDWPKSSNFFIIYPSFKALVTILSTRSFWNCKKPIILVNVQSWSS